MDFITKKTLDEAFFINLSEFSDEEMLSINGGDCPEGPWNWCYGLPCTKYCYTPPTPKTSGCGN